MQKIIIKKRFLLPCFWILLSCISFAFAVEFDRIDIEVGGKALNVEYAHKFEQRAQGLMFREKLCGDCGMLFKYPKQKVASMWMKNTLIPLDVAFIKADGTIVDILAMQPQDLTSIRSSENVLYALEMNQGWFAENDIDVGQVIKILEL